MEYNDLYESVSVYVIHSKGNTCLSTDRLVTIQKLIHPAIIYRLFNIHICMCDIPKILRKESIHLWICYCDCPKTSRDFSILFITTYTQWELRFHRFHPHIASPHPWQRHCLNRIRHHIGTAPYYRLQECYRFIWDGFIK